MIPKDYTSNMSELKEIEITKRSGDEKFRDGNNNLDFNLLSFWQWSSSDIVSNATRGILAEYIVGKALGCIKEEDIRDEWGAYDLATQAGVRIEVKSAAYVQSWQQSRLSKIRFNVPKTLGWDKETNKFVSLFHPNVLGTLNLILDSLLCSQL